MIIETKYDIGDVFYIAKCRKMFVGTSTIVHDGFEYKREIWEWRPDIRKIVIFECNAIRGEGRRDVYRVEYFYPSHSSWTGDNDFPSRTFGEEDFQHFFYTEELAMTVAQSFADKKEEYHGYPTDF